MATDDLEARQRRLERRQAMADALMAQGRQTPQGQMVSGHYVAPSPFEYLAKAGQQFMGNRAQRNLDQQQDTLDDEQRAMTTAALKDYISTRQGDDPYAAAVTGAASENPVVQKAALAELAELLKPEKWKEGGIRRDPATGELVPVLISNRGNERRSDFGAAPEMRVSGGEVYDPRRVQPGQQVGRDSSQLTAYQAEQLKMQQDRLRADLETRQETERLARERLELDRTKRATKPPTEGQAKANAFAVEMEAALRDVDAALAEMGSKENPATQPGFTSQALGSVPLAGDFLRNVWASPAEQKYYNGMRRLVTAKLRADSGATITQSEIDEQLNQMLPKATDTKEVVEQKKEALNTAIQSVRSRGTPGTAGYGNRPDGTAKGGGFLGELRLPGGGVATEYSTQSDAVTMNGRRVDFPTLVPTLSPEEVQMMTNDIIPNRRPIPEPIMQKAIQHARSRIQAGQSPFAGESAGAPPPPGAEPSIDDLLQQYGGL